MLCVYFVGSKNWHLHVSMALCSIQFKIDLIVMILFTHGNIVDSCYYNGNWISNISIGYKYQGHVCKHYTSLHSCVLNT